MADIFVSYASVDREIARCLAGRLEQEGWSVWWDRQLVPGDQFSRFIQTELHAAGTAVVLWSSASVESEWVEIEAGYAHKHNKLVPVLIEDVGERIPLEFGRLHAANLIGWGGAGDDPELRSLIEAVRARSDGSLPPAAPAPQGEGVYGQAQAAFGRREFQESARLFERALVLGLPDNLLATTYSSLGNAYNELDRLDEAGAASERALQLNPREHRAWLNLGIVHRLQGRFDDAERCYQEALQLAPGDPAVHASLGALYIVRGEPERAVESLQRAVGLGPGHAVAHGNLALALAMVGDFEKADGSLRTAVAGGYQNAAVIGERIANLKRAAGTE
ncbi:MAG: toll/interleukin-1 receptor domain-containing protein [Thermoleophilaceae bacterium]